jgi:leader peptidase (prepilin peptidase)/N-methyltransferase
MSGDGWFPLVGLVMALAGGVLGWFVPALIARIPEPDPDVAPTGHDAETGAFGDEDPAAEAAADDAAPEAAGEAGAETAEGRDETTDEAEEEPKERYDAIAALPGLAWKSAVASAVAAGLVGLRLGWDPALLAWAYLVPVGVALAVVDWRTRLLPTKVIAPSYAVVVALTLLAGLVAGDGGDLVRAAWGGLVAGGTFFELWFIYPRGMGYGDVRLSGILGIALGYLGWAELLTGIYAGFLIGGVGGLLLSLLRVVDR